MTFKAKKFKQWTLTDDEIIIGRKKIPLTSLIEVKQYAPWKSEHVNGTIFIKYGMGAFDNKTLVYPKAQKDEGDKAAEYLLSFVKEVRNTDTKKSSSVKQVNKKQPNFLFMTFITLAITLFIMWLIGVTFFGWNDNANKSSKTNYKNCAMCGDRVPEDEMSGRWCKDCQNDAFDEDGWYDKIKD